MIIMRQVRDAIANVLDHTTLADTCAKKRLPRDSLTTSNNRHERFDQPVRDRFMMDV